MGNPAKFDRCVRKVRRKSRGRVNAYAVCTAGGTRNPKGILRLVPHRLHPGYFIADKVEDQKRLSEIGWGPKTIRESDLDTILNAASSAGFVLEVEQPRSGNPKDAADMSAPEINKALDKLDAKLSDLNRRMIDAGWGDKRPSDFPAGHPLTEEYNRLHTLRSPLGIERDLRYGPGAPSRLPKGRGFGPRKWGRNPIQDPNSSGQGYDPDHTRVPYESILSQYGYSYSHSTPVVYPSGRKIHHAYAKGDHKVGVWDAFGVWKWEAHKGGSGHSYGGSNAESLEKYLKGRSKKGNPEGPDGNWYFKNRAAALSYATKLKRKGIIARAEHYGMGGDREWVVWVGGSMYSGPYNAEHEARKRSNPDSGAADMYSSFHGSPSEEVVEFREDEHYHGNLAGLGVLVELKLVTTTGYDVTLTFSDPEALIAANPGVWDRIKKIGSRSTVYPMPTHVEKMTKVGSVKGHEIFKTVHGDFRVPSLERESSFDSLGDAKKFVGAWKGNPQKWYLPKKRGKVNYEDVGYRPYLLQHDVGFSGKKIYRPVRISEQGGFTLLGNYGMDRKSAMDWIKAQGVAQNPGPFQSASRLMGTTGKYLDDKLGRLLNPWEGGQYIPEMYRDEYMEIGEVFTSPVYGRAQIRTRQETGESGKPKYIYTFIPVTKRERTRRGKKPYFPKHSNPGNPSQDPTLLCSNESGTQLYLQGGDQSVDLSTIHMADTPVKDSMVLGEAYFISYFTAKDFDNHAPTIYEHDLAEESDPPKPKYRKDEIHTAANRPGMGQGLGCYPVVRYDHLNQKLYLDGGEYKIDKPIMGTSPGIEN